MPNTLVRKVFTAGDRRTSVADTLTDANGTVIDLTGMTVVFRLETAAGTTLINYSAATVDSAAAGNVSYQWSAQNMTDIIAALAAAESLICNYWWRVTSSSLEEHFPGDQTTAAPKRQIEFIKRPVD